MPKLVIEMPHAIGKAEAIERIQRKADSVRGSLPGQVTDLTETWDENRLAFGFKAMGMKISGTVVVEDARTQVSAELPFAAMMFKGMIEQRIRAELGPLLA